jgi:hypothetical protein
VGGWSYSSEGVEMMRVDPVVHVRDGYEIQSGAAGLVRVRAEIWYRVIPEPGEVSSLVEIHEAVDRHVAVLEETFRRLVPEARGIDVVLEDQSREGTHEVGREPVARQGSEATASGEGGRLEEGETGVVGEQSSGG